MSKKNQNTIKTEWNLKLLYKSVDDPQIEIDISNAEKAYLAFAKKYTKRTDYLKNENSLFHALEDSEKLSYEFADRPIYYLHYAQDLNSKDEHVRAKMNLLAQRIQKMSNHIVFFGINLSKLPQNIQKFFLVSKRLSKYNYMLQKTFESGKYTLSESEEKILSLKSLPSHTLWVSAIEKLESKQTVEHKGKKLPLNEANSLIREQTTQKERVDLSKKVMDKFYEIAEMAESELNAVVIDKKIDDELRGFKEPYDATLLSYENDKVAILSLVKTVTDNFHIAKKFYVIKARMLNLKTFNYSDRNVSAGVVKRKVSFEESYRLLYDLFSRVDVRFADILKTFVEKGQIDVYPKMGKTGGAYCSSSHNNPTFVLLNHINSLESLKTFAHEMGHAIHTEFSKSQPTYYQDYSMSAAETASTLFESFLFYDQFDNLSEAEKIIALHDKIQDDISTIFRQIACFNFELEMHNTIREKGNMSKEELAGCMNKHMASYMGKNVKFVEKDGYFFVGWSHLRRFFYVYSYAFGKLASKALYKNYSEDKTYIEKIKTFLSLGGSMSPEDVFKSIGVDVKKPDFWKLGMKSIEEDINLLEKLVNKK
ncbi:MAG: hypothetical protein EXS47_00075 [Candidatus Zambryskibacteria bacterium]|nr:hypothetical protein [Candidatus Zambryskibacteria bacterium]